MTNALDKRIRLGSEFVAFLASFDTPVPVREDAEFHRVSPTTIWRWRHRVLSYLVKLAQTEPRMLDGKVVIFTRTITNLRSRWSRETDLLWRRRGSPLPRETPKQRHRLTLLFAVRIDEDDDPRGLPVLALVYVGSATKREIGDALFPHLLPSARVYGPTGLVARRLSVREAVSKSPWSWLYVIEAIPPELECVRWEEMHEVEPEFRMSGADIIDARSFPASLHRNFARWMTLFRAVRLHYLHRYLEWFQRLLYLHIAGELPLIVPMPKQLGH